MTVANTKKVSILHSIHKSFYKAIILILFWSIISLPSLTIVGKH